MKATDDKMTFASVDTIRHDRSAANLLCNVNRGLSGRSMT